MFIGAKEHYNNYYRYDLSSGEDSVEIVNNLFIPVMKNDKEALNKVLRIISGRTYYKVWGMLDEVGRATVENVDDVMQSARLEIIKLAFRGFPERVSEDGFYGYLYKIFVVCTNNFKKLNKKLNEREEYEKDKSDEEENSYIADVFDNIESDYFKTSRESVAEKQIIIKEKREIYNTILARYIKALQESKLEPHQLLTYCYAILIPQLIKKTDNVKLLNQVEKLSMRKSYTTNSYYDAKENKLKGKIARDSVILISWAIEAMYKMRVGQLDDEFQELYSLEKIADTDFCWGFPFKENMERINKAAKIVEREVVITDTYSESSIKNWPARVAESLLTNTEKQLMEETSIRRNSTKIIEDILC